MWNRGSMSRPHLLYRWFKEQSNSCHVIIISRRTKITQLSLSPCFASTRGDRGRCQVLVTLDQGWSSVVDHLNNGNWYSMRGHLFCPNFLQYTYISIYIIDARALCEDINLLTSYRLLPILSTPSRLLSILSIPSWLIHQNELKTIRFLQKYKGH